MNSDVLVGFKGGVEGAIAVATVGSATTHAVAAPVGGRGGSTDPARLERKKYWYARSRPESPNRHPRRPPETLDSSFPAPQSHAARPPRAATPSPPADATPRRHRRHAHPPPPPRPAAAGPRVASPRLGLAARAQGSRTPPRPAAPDGRRRRGINGFRLRRKKLQLEHRKKKNQQPP
jgi:hypothetical protein